MVVCSAGARVAGERGRDERGEEGETGPGVLGSGLHQLAQFSGHALYQVPPEGVWLVEEDSAHTLTLTSLPQT